MSVALTVVIPAYNEDDSIVPVLDRIFDAVESDCEIFVVVDDGADSTVPVLERYREKEPRLRTLVNTYGRGPANAIRYGIDQVTTPVVVVTMADGASLAGHPAISLPLGQDRSGMPFGLQMVGPRGGDAFVLAVAAALERALAEDPRTARPVPDLAALRAAPSISAGSRAGEGRV